MEVSKMKVMSLNELKFQLGVHSEDEVHMSCVFENVTNSDSATIVSVANLSISETNSPVVCTDCVMASGHETLEAEQGSDSETDYTPSGAMEHSTLMGKVHARAASPSLRPLPLGEEVQVVKPNTSQATFQHHNRLPLQNIANQQRKLHSGAVKHSRSAALKGGEYTRRVHATTDTHQVNSEAN